MQGRGHVGPCCITVDVNCGRFQVQVALGKHLPKGTRDKALHLLDAVFSAAQRENTPNIAVRLL